MKRPFMGIGIALAAGVAAGWFGLSGYSIFLAIVLTLGIAIAGYTCPPVPPPDNKIFI